MVTTTNYSPLGTLGSSSGQAAIRTPGRWRDPARVDATASSPVRQVAETDAAVAVA